MRPWLETVEAARKHWDLGEYIESFADLTLIDDRAFDGLTFDGLMEIIGARPPFYVFIVDSHDDLRRDEIRILRVAPGETVSTAAIENNLSLAYMDFEDFASSTDEDGVFRGFRVPGVRCRGSRQVVVRNGVLGWCPFGTRPWHGFRWSEFPQLEQCGPEGGGADVVVGPQPWTGMPEVGEHLLGDVEGQWGQVGADAQENQCCSAGSWDAEGFGGHDGRWVDPFVVVGDKEDDVAGCDGAGCAQA